MSLFRVNDTTNFEGPHQSTPVLKGGAESSEAEAAMILIHGRGATAKSILTLTDELEINKKLTIRAPQASQNTWYPYSFMAPSKNNEPNLSSALQKIFDIVQGLKEEGFIEENIYLTGFSQGACLISEFVARHPEKYGGLIALSGGLIGTGDSVNPKDYEGDLKGTPVFLGCSDVDPHIPKKRVNESEELLNKLNADVTKKLYPGMGHTVNQNEIDHMNRIINS
ncbi:MAG: dienelactone hydrolase family protein [Gracilimonas sp.]|nr:dienelactone hydrolase family protein [Gracilimonas sp.]